MPEVKIESLTFPPKEVHLIKLSRSGIRITIKDPTLQNKGQYEKWIHICGTMHQQEVEQVSIGRNHYEDKKFLFTCNATPGIAGITPDGISIQLEFIDKE